MKYGKGSAPQQAITLMHACSLAACGGSDHCNIRAASAGDKGIADFLPAEGPRNGGFAMELLHIDVTLVTSLHEVEGRLSFCKPKKEEEIRDIVFRVWREIAEKVLTLGQEKVSVEAIVFDLDQIEPREKARAAFWSFMQNLNARPVNTVWNITSKQGWPEER